MSQSNRIFNVVDTISHFFSIQKGEEQYLVTHHEVSSTPLSPTEDSLQLSDVLNYVKVADDGSLSNASSSDVLTELDPPIAPPSFLDPIDHSGGGEHFGG
jgi:hypothetical protein